MVVNTMSAGKWISGTKILLTGLFLSVILPGCTNLTEYEMTFEAGLYVISPDDFSTMAVVSDIAGARSLFIYPGNIFVVSTEGTISRYDSESMELVDKYKVAAPSPAGFSQIVYCTKRNTAYLIGPLGKIIEISLPDCTVIDEFSACQSPVGLALGPGSDYLFVADGPSRRVYQVFVNNNQVYDDCPTYNDINCMAPHQNPDTMLIGTSDGIVFMEVLGSTALRSYLMIKGFQCTALASIPDYNFFVGVMNGYVGIVDPFHPEPVDASSRSVPVFIGGTAHFIAIGNDWQHVYVLAYVGNNTSKLISYNYCSTEPSRELYISGYPLDLKVSGSGNIYVLTAE